MRNKMDISLCEVLHLKFEKIKKIFYHKCPMSLQIFHKSRSSITLEPKKNILSIKMNL